MIDLGFFQPLIEGLPSNLLAETVGILVTVFLVDRLIKRNEKLRWAPVRDWAHARLFETTESLLAKLLPAHLISDEEGFCIWEFGESAALSLKRPAPELSALNEWQILELLPTEPGVDQNSLQQAHVEIPAIVQTSMTVLEPGLIKAASQLQYHLGYLLASSRSGVWVKPLVANVLFLALRVRGLVAPYGIRRGVSPPGPGTGASIA